MKALTAPFLLPVSQKPIADGVIVVDEGRIIEAGAAEKILPKYPDVDINDFPNAVLMPGLVNAHAHLDLLSFKEPAGGDFFDRLMTSWDHRKVQTLADRRHCLEEGIGQSVRSGVTSIGDVGQFFGLIPQAINSPIRMVLFPELLHGGDSSPPVQESYEALFSQVDEILKTENGRVSAGIAPYAAYTLSRNLLKIISQQARRMRLPLKIHVSETFSEMQFFYESSGEILEKLFPKMGWGELKPPARRETPIQYLESIGFLEGGATLVGCNHLAADDFERIRKTGSKVVYAPRANAHLKLGVPPIKKLLKAGVPVAIGTDGASLFSLSLWDEMRHLANLSPASDRPSATDILTMATLNGAKALGLEEKVGSIEPGKEADLIAVRVPKGTALKDISSWLIEHATDREIAAVFVEGKRIKL